MDAITAETIERTRTDEFSDVRLLFLDFYEEFLRVNKFDQPPGNVRTIKKSDVAYTCVQLFMDIITQEVKLKDNTEINQYSMAIFGPLLDQVNPNLNQQVINFVNQNPHASYPSIFAFAYSQNNRISFSDITPDYLYNYPILEKHSKASIAQGDIKIPKYSQPQTNNN